MELTIYELLGLIKDGKAPAKIKDGIIIYNFDEKKNDYQDPFSKNWSFLYKKLGKAIDNVNDFLNDTVEIFEEEKDEWEDIDEIDKDNYEFTTLDLKKKVNQLIKNQKCLKRRLDKNDR